MKDAFFCAQDFAFSSSNHSFSNPIDAIANEKRIFEPENYAFVSDNDRFSTQIDSFAGLDDGEAAPNPFSLLAS